MEELMRSIQAVEATLPVGRRDEKQPLIVPTVEVSPTTVKRSERDELLLANDKLWGECEQLKKQLAEVTMALVSSGSSVKLISRRNWRRRSAMRFWISCHRNSWSF